MTEIIIIIARPAFRHVIMLQFGAENHCSIEINTFFSVLVTVGVIPVGCSLQ